MDKSLLSFAMQWKMLHVHKIGSNAKKPGWCVRRQSRWSYTCHYSRGYEVANCPDSSREEKAYSLTARCPLRRSSHDRLRCALLCPADTKPQGMHVDTWPAWTACSLLHSCYNDTLLVGWCRGNAFYLINKVTLCQATLVLGWVTAYGR